MKKPITVYVAIAIGQWFVLVESDKIRGYRCKNSYELVSVNNMVYPLYRPMDADTENRFDNEVVKANGMKRIPISDFAINNKGEKDDVYDVTITRFGCVHVRAKSMEEAILKANTLPEDKITWNDEFEATDAVKLGRDEQTDRFVFVGE